MNKNLYTRHGSDIDQRTNRIFPLGKKQQQQKTKDSTNKGILVDLQNQWVCLDMPQT